MLWCKAVWLRNSIVALVAVSALSGCTVEPLNPKVSTETTGNQVAGNKLSNISVAPVSERIAQQVRNHLIFGINGGGSSPDAKYTVALTVTTTHADLVVLTQTKSPTSAQVTVSAQYVMKTANDGTIISTGSRSSISSYDRTTQSFANQRAKRDAENRAAREVAQLLRFAIAAAVPTDGS